LIYHYEGIIFLLLLTDNRVMQQSSPDLVLQSSDTKLKIMTDLTTSSGPVKVSIGGHTAIGPYDFKIPTYTQPTEGVDGSPILFAGRADVLSGMLD
jgi:hypothetical protein